MKVGETTLTPTVWIEEIKGTCPKCGGPLTFREHVQGWDSEGKPTDVFRDPYCAKCNLYWIAEEPNEALDKP